MTALIDTSLRFYDDGPSLCTFVAFHDIDAAATRGVCQALENAARIWRDLHKLGMSPRDIRSDILGPWAAAVERWIAKPIDPSVIHPPPGPEEFLALETRRVVDLLPYMKATTAPSISHAAAPSGPAAITRRLNDVTREVLEWLWPGRVPPGKLTLLAGDPGLGKSCFDNLVNRIEPSGWRPGGSGHNWQCHMSVVNELHVHSWKGPWSGRRYDSKVEHAELRVTLPVSLGSSVSSLVARRTSVRMPNPSMPTKVTNVASRTAPMHPAT
jgi:hypothetical protein